MLTFEEAVRGGLTQNFIVNGRIRKGSRVPALIFHMNAAGYTVGGPTHFARMLAVTGFKVVPGYVFKPHRAGVKRVGGPVKVVVEA